MPKYISQIFQIFLQYSNNWKSRPKSKQHLYNQQQTSNWTGILNSVGAYDESFNSPWYINNTTELKREIDNEITEFTNNFTNIETRNLIIVSFSNNDKADNPHPNNKI